MLAARDSRRGRSLPSPRIRTWAIQFQSFSCPQKCVQAFVGHYASYKADTILSFKPKHLIDGQRLVAFDIDPVRRDRYLGFGNPVLYPNAVLKPESSRDVISKEGRLQLKTVMQQKAVGFTPIGILAGLGQMPEAASLVDHWKPNPTGSDRSG